MQRVTPVVLNLIIINALVCVALNIFGNTTAADWLVQYFLLFKSDLIIHRPLGLDEYFKPVQIVTSFFAHIDIIHILFNMFALFSIGTAVESVIGSKRFLLEYLIFGVGSGILIAFLDPSPYPVLGASTAISGLLVSFALRFPDARLMFFPIPFSLKAIYYVGILALISVIFIVISITSGNDVGRVSHFGHLAGLVVAFVYLQGWKHLNLGSRNRNRWR